VLIVDDDDSIRETLRFALEDEGYEVLEAKGGAEALDLLPTTSRRFIVLLDHILGDIDGVSVLRQMAQHLSQAARHMYVLVTASDAVEALEQELRDLPLAPITIIRKPFDIDALFAVVREANTKLELEAQS
jgi:CheY-like chemotaxis protein